MKIEFNDKSYIECHKSDSDKIIITVSSKDYENPLKRITSTVEIGLEDFKKLISDVQL